MRTFSRGAAVAVAGLALLAVAMIAWRVSTWAEPTASRPLGPVRTLTLPAGPTPTTPAFPSAEPSFDVQLPLTTTDVAVGRPVRITGAGPRQIAFTVSDASVVTAHLDCSLCTGLVRYVAGDSPTPLFSGVAPYEGDHVFTGTRGFLSLNATDRWTITLTAKSR